jgi:hypothetical protein
LVLRDRQRLAVKRVVQTWTAQTPYGPIRLPSDALASIQLAGSKTTAPHLKLANGSTISGLLSIGPLETTLQMGMQVTLPLWHIREIIFPRSAEIDPNQPTITLLNGDRIIAAVTSPRLVLQTPLEELLLPVDQLAALARQGDSHTFTVTLRDESMLSGRLVEGLEVTLPAGQGLTLPASCIQSVRWPTPSSAPSPATTRPGEATTRPAS